MNYCAFQSILGNEKFQREVRLLSCRCPGRFKVLLRANLEVSFGRFYSLFASFFNSISQKEQTVEIFHANFYVRPQQHLTTVTFLTIKLLAKTFHFQA